MKDGAESLGLDATRRAPALASAAIVLEVLEAVAALREARAVLADIDEVGGLDTRIDLRGDSNVAWAEGCSGADKEGTKFAETARL